MTAAYAVIPTRNRPGMLADCIDSLLASPQVCGVVVIDNGSTPPVDTCRWEKWVTVLRWPQDPPNISKLWNLGLDWVAADIQRLQDRGGSGWETWDVLVVNDDVVCPPDFVHTLGKRMRATGAAMAYPDQAGGSEEILHTEPGPVPLGQRITGYAFMLRGETGLRADESLAWWFGDDDLDWRARQQSGALLVPGIPVEHRAPDVQTNARPELVEQTRRDRETFINRWGKAPW
ncbi:glycosyltransferase family 2 protein [Streptomyces sp. NPDC058464]|uniref:glycosyltransferase family 2 protein n=1 Tax=Streptomyces sp. NPDC058464 TaxID=3346511 RepID=UPI00365D03AA